jgi:hypothetical protein
MAQQNDSTNFIPGMDGGDEERRALADEAFRVHGKVVHNAALADSYMYEVFHHYAGTTRAIAQAIFFTLDSSKARHTLTTRTARAAKADDGALKAIDKLAAAISKTLEHRNSIAHAFLLQDDQIFSDGEIRVVNPKAVHASGRRGKSANPSSPANPGHPTSTVSLTSLQQSLRASDQNLRAATLAFRALCRSIGRRSKVTLALS